MNILIVNGPNLKALEFREKEVYGSVSYSFLKKALKQEARKLKVHLCFFVSNYEGKLIDRLLKRNFDGLVINPGGLSHTSVALHDSLKILKVPKVEVHLSDVLKREDFRHNLITAKACDLTVMGKGINGYLEALSEVVKRVKNY